MTFDLLRNLFFMVLGFVLLLIFFTLVFKKDIQTLLRVLQIGIKKEFTTKSGGICIVTLLLVAFIGLLFISESNLKYWYMLLFKGRETELDFSKAEAFWGVIGTFIVNCVLLGIMRSKKP